MFNVSLLICSGCSSVTSVRAAWQMSVRVGLGSRLEKTTLQFCQVWEELSVWKWLKNPNPGSDPCLICVLNQPIEGSWCLNCPELPIAPCLTQPLSLCCWGVTGVCFGGQGCWGSNHNHPQVPRLTPTKQGVCWNSFLGTCCSL